MIPFLQTMASGILMGTLYALIASGFALILGAARVFNLAHGDLVILGAYVGYGLWTAHRLHPLLASPLAVLLLIPLALALRPLLAKLKGPFELKALVLTFGLSLFLQNVMQALFTSNYRLIMVPAFEEGVSLGPVRVAQGRLLVAGLAVALLAILHILLHHTFLGKAMRAVIQDREAASLMGIDTRRVELYVLGLGGAMAGLAGPLFASLHYITPTAGLDITIIALILTIFGGVGRLLGLFLGGLLFGLAEALAVAFWGAQWKEFVSFLVLLLLFQWRAFGLLRGRRSS